MSCTELIALCGSSLNWPQVGKTHNALGLLLSSRVSVLTFTAQLHGNAGGGLALLVFSILVRSL